jgi:hypothetical protein
MRNLFHILKSRYSWVRKEELQKYLQQKMKEEEAHEFEEKMASSAFLNDAVEGLQQFSSTEKIENYTAELNKQLQRLTAKKVVKKNKGLAVFPISIWLTLVLLLIFIIIVAVMVIFYK